MFPDDKIMCHHTGFQKPCFDMVTKCKCRKWVHFIGQNPQTGQDVDVWDCRDHLDHFFNVQVVQAVRQATASVDSLRREVAEQNDQSVVGALSSLNRTIAMANNGQDLPALANGGQALIGKS